MHDTLQYFSLDPVYRSHHQGQLTFAMIYEYSERFIMPLSHDEVVHMKRSLLDKMPGDVWQKFANLRLLLAYMYTRPGKKLLFMGSELAPWNEWNHDSSVDWHLRDDPQHGAFERFVGCLGALYLEHPALWRMDYEPQGFQWIDTADVANSVVSYVRRGGGEQLLVALNLTPIPREHYRIGVPENGEYTRIFSSDDPRFGGSGLTGAELVRADPSPLHGYPQSVELTLPPLGALVLAPVKRGAAVGAGEEEGGGERGDRSE
jgi:1,4-alpha-glucan branching enzyme